MCKLIIIETWPIQFKQTKSRRTVNNNKKKSIES